jgi:nucleotide-binding universal stress UspA family protein
MGTERKPKIACAIRGGDGSRRAQERTIALAQERHAHVIFLHVVDTNVVEQMGTPIAETVLDEMKCLGASLLSIASERASAQGLSVETILLTGSVRTALETFLRESSVTTLVMGTPNADMPPIIFDDLSLKQLVEHLQSTLNIEVVIA